MLTFPSGGGEPVTIPALMFELVDTPGIERFQIVQTAPTNLLQRLRALPGADAERVWQAAQAEISRVLAHPAANSARCFRSLTDRSPVSPLSSHHEGRRQDGRPPPNGQGVRIDRDDQCTARICHPSGVRLNTMSSTPALLIGRSR